MAANERHPQPPQTRQTPAGTRRSLKQHHGPSRTACPRAKHTPRSRRRRPESPLYATPSLAEASVNRGRASVLVGRPRRAVGHPCATHPLAGWTAVRVTASGWTSPVCTTAGVAGTAASAGDERIVAVRSPRLAAARRTVARLRQSKGGPRQTLSRGQRPAACRMSSSIMRR